MYIQMSKRKLTLVVKKFTFYIMIVMALTGCKNVQLLHLVDTSLSARGEDNNSNFIKNAKHNCSLLSSISSPGDFFEIIPATAKPFISDTPLPIKGLLDSKNKCRDFFTDDNLKSVSSNIKGDTTIEYPTDACEVLSRAQQYIQNAKVEDQGLKGILIIYEIQVDDNISRGDYCYEQASEFAKYLNNNEGIMIITGSEELPSEPFKSEVTKAFEKYPLIARRHKFEDIETQVRKYISQLRTK